MIELRELSKSFNSVQALNAVDLNIPRGQTTVLIGPSGCGKSTLLRTLIGLEQPDRGSITIGETEVRPANVQSLRRRIGYVIQEGGLFPHLTAQANIDIMARHLGHDADKSLQRVHQLCELTGFPLDGLERFPLELSGGQRQRVGLMRALMLDPDVLLLDEPLGALDPMIRSDLQRDLRAIFERLNKTVVMVTHDLGEAAYLGHQIVLMRAGKIVQAAAMQDLLQNPADEFVSRFIQAQRSPLEEFERDNSDGQPSPTKPQAKSVKSAPDAGNSAQKGQS